MAEPLHPAEDDDGDQHQGVLPMEGDNEDRQSDDDSSDLGSGAEEFGVPQLALLSQPERADYLGGIPADELNALLGECRPWHDGVRNEIMTVLRRRMPEPQGADLIAAEFTAFAAETAAERAEYLAQTRTAEVKELLAMCVSPQHDAVRAEIQAVLEGRASDSSEADSESDGDPGPEDD